MFFFSSVRRIVFLTDFHFIKNSQKMEVDGETDPLIPPGEDEDKDEDEENTTQPFQPGGHSTPGHKEKKFR